MIEMAGDIWDFHDKGNWIGITTNGTVKKNSECVMGKGVAFQAKQKFPNIAYQIGSHIKHSGNWPLFMRYEKIFTIPVKHNWWEKADIELIKQSCRWLQDLVELSLAYLTDPLDSEGKFYMVRPGCGNGQLRWEYVKPEIENILDDRFVIVEKY